MREVGIQTGRSVVLVVDDDITLRFLARQSLEDEGFIVEEAEDGVLALAVFERVRPEVVLLDVNMPKMDGFAVCSKLRQTSFGDSTSVLMMTGLDDVESINRAYEVGATDFITKPINWTILTYRIRYVLRASRAREALRLSQTRLANAQRAAHLGNWDLNLQTEELHCSDEVYRIFALTPQTLGASFEVLLRTAHPDDRGRISKSLQDAFETRKPDSLDYRIVLPSDQQRIVHQQVEIISDATGRPIRMSATVQDITERKQSEEAMRKAKEAAEAATKAKSVFLANMSHELRTPMSAIIGMTDMLLEDALSSEQQESVDIIHSSSNHLLSLINDILDFSKIEAGELVLEHRAFDLHQCVEEALELLAPKAAEKGLALFYFIEPQTPATLMGDVTRLRQILVNLISNAVKFTGAGEIVVSVGSRSLDVQWHELHFAVQDSGIGIPSDKLHRLFQSFSQVDASTTRQYGGTGLGLAISKQLVELFEGTIRVESTEGQGSTFFFTVVAEVAPSPLPLYLRGSQPQLSGKRVLIVDDNDTSRNLLTLQVQAWGMLPQATASSSQALAWIRDGAPSDSAIVDMQMPGVEGLTLAAAMRQYGDALPLVLLTSIGGQAVGTQPLPRTTYVTKPVKTSTLYEALVKMVARQTDPDTHLAQPRHSPPPMAEEQVPLRILVVDDDMVNQRVAQRLLERLGHRIDVAANGLEALETLTRQSYDVVFMDVQMPEMDGLTTTQRICQQWPATHRPRIIAMTANAMQEDREACLAAGMDDYVSKPVAKEILLAILARCCPLQTAGTATTASP